MVDLNKVFLIWRIATDLEVKKMWDSWISVINFTIATNRNYKNKNWEKIEETEFHRCVAYGSLADVFWQYLAKGRKVYVEWRLRTRHWEDPNGNKRYTTEIVITDLNFCDSKWNNVSSQNTSYQDVSQTDNQIDNDSTTEEDIPF